MAPNTWRKNPKLVFLSCTPLTSGCWHQDLLVIVLSTYRYPYQYQIVAVISCAILNSIHFICDSALINAFNLIVFLEGDSRYSSQLTPRNVRIEKYQNHGKEPLHLGQFPDLASSPTSHRIRLSVKMMTVNGVLLAPPLACVVGSTKEQSACLLMIGTCRDHRYVISRYIWPFANWLRADLVRVNIMSLLINRSRKNPRTETHRASKKKTNPHSNISACAYPRAKTPITVPLRG